MLFFHVSILLFLFPLSWLIAKKREQALAEQQRLMEEKQKQAAIQREKEAQENAIKEKEAEAKGVKEKEEEEKVGGFVIFENKLIQ